MKLKELEKHGSVWQQAELKRLAVEIAKVKDSFQMRQRKISNIEKYKKVKGRRFFSFHHKLEP